MSYILDAMRKSERDATMGRPINLPSTKAPWRKKLAYLLLALILAGFIATATWYAANWQSAVPSSSSSVSPVVASTPLPDKLAAVPSNQTIEISIDPTPVIEPSPPVRIGAEVSSIPTQPVTSAKATSWRELPDAAQFITQLPESLFKLRIGIHVFDQTPSSRFLLINGRRYQQGDELAGVNGARISEITPDGIAIKYRNLHFHKNR